ncbi:hypothetical protein [uncultured Brachyspira sp.]|uniref:hypothetical protein n=1 Tax=uncultured Brachyspira sp. TaxID=221953 RepID=UPI0025F5D148|nr:hypothetical protein [uncultured Brachyspira sp.]
MKKIIFICFIVLSFIFISCEKDKIEKTIDKASDNIEKTIDKAEKKIEKAGDKAKDNLDEAAEKIAGFINEDN